MIPEPKSSGGYHRYRLADLAFHPSRIVICLGLLGVLGAMSLSFVGGEGVRRDSIQADALPCLLLVLPAFAISLLPDRRMPVRSRQAWMALLPAATAFAYSLVVEISAAAQAASLGGTPGAGGLLLVFGTLVTMAGPGLGLLWERTGWPIALPTAPRSDSPDSRASQAGRPPQSPRPRRPVTITDPPRRAAPPPSPAESPVATGRRAPTQVPKSRRSEPPPAPPAAPRDGPTAPGQWWPEDLDDLFK